MTHPCTICGSECFCGGAKRSCTGCGCQYDDEDDNDRDAGDEIIIGFECVGCGHVQNNARPCEKCAADVMKPMYF